MQYPVAVVVEHMEEELMVNGNNNITVTFHLYGIYPSINAARESLLMARLEEKDMDFFDRSGDRYIIATIGNIISCVNWQEAPDAY